MEGARAAIAAGALDRATPLVVAAVEGCPDGDLRDLQRALWHLPVAHGQDGARTAWAAWSILVERDAFDGRAVVGLLDVATRLGEARAGLDEVVAAMLATPAPASGRTRAPRPVEVHVVDRMLQEDPEGYVPHLARLLASGKVSHRIFRDYAPSTAEGRAVVERLLAGARLRNWVIAPEVSPAAARALLAVLLGYMASHPERTNVAVDAIGLQLADLVVDGAGPARRCPLGGADGPVGGRPRRWPAAPAGALGHRCAGDVGDVPGRSRGLRVGDRRAPDRRHRCRRAA